MNNASSTNQNSELYIGLMSGTSLDGVDAVLADFAQHPPHLLAYHYLPYSVDLKQRLMHLSHQPEVQVTELGEVGVELGIFYAKVTNELVDLSAVSAAQVRAIGCHGQTIRHKPIGRHPFTLQVGDASVVVELTGITTIAQFRQRDMAAGGQGAPLVPAFHQFLFADATEDRVVLNLGGIANISCLPHNSERLVGFDTGPANVLLDGWCHQYLNLPYDKDGSCARSGNIIEPLLHLLQSHPYFDLPPPKSTGRELFHLLWVHEQLEQLKGDYAHGDVLRTLTELTAWSVAKGVSTSLKAPQTLIACGGGSFNSFLLERLATYLPQTRIQTSSDFGIRPDHMEALAFAWLARQTMKGLAGNHPDVTGAKGFRILGAIYPA